MEEEMNLNFFWFFGFKFESALGFLFGALLLVKSEELKVKSVEDHQKYMKRAITLAFRGKGWVNPNPMVGAVIVKNGKIIGEGYHEYFGGAHAEVNAFNKATEEVEGAVLYVTLEPCSFFGKTPPCAPLIAEKGIQKVVIGIMDPNPKMNGSGVAYLRSKGIEVMIGVMEDAVRKINETFIKFITTGIPFTILKTAMTLDGKIATVTNASQWISGELSRKYVHEMRQQISGIMVGVNTIIYDDPLLNTRRKGKKNKDPLKIVADTHGRIPLESKVLKHNPQFTILATTELAEKSKLNEIERTGAQTIICPLKEGKVDLAFLMKALGTMGLDSILIEGGSSIAFSAFTEGLIDKVFSFISPKILGGKNAPTPVGGQGIENMKEAIQIRNWKMRKVGEDFLIEGEVNN